MEKGPDAVREGLPSKAALRARPLPEADNSNASAGNVALRPRTARYAGRGRAMVDIVDLGSSP